MLSERAKKADDSCLRSVRVVCVVIRLLYFSCDLLIVFAVVFSASNTFLF